ncbi:hypothetical protein [Spiroplasma endosymbiont of Labia minor]
MTQEEMRVRGSLFVRFKNEGPNRYRILHFANSWLVYFSKERKYYH